MLPQLLPSTSKKAIANFAAKSVEQLLEQGNVLQAAEVLAALENFIKEVKADSRFKELICSELDTNGGSITTATGAKIETMEGGVSYNYSATPEWVELDNSIATLETKKKALEMRLRSIPAGKLLVDEQTGETLIGPSKTSKTTYKITLAK